MEQLPVWVLSLGCPKNTVDTEHFLGTLGLDIVTVSALADAKLVFINTCGFIESAVRESVRAILEVVDEIKELPNKPLVVVGGCLVGRYGVKELAAEIPEVDLFLDTSDLDRWPEYVRKLIGSDLSQTLKVGRLLSTPPSYAWLKIAEGCRHNCAFCSIPMIRGTLKSVSSSQIVGEARELLDHGVKELICVAQDVASWGQDKGESLQDLIRELVRLPNLLWLRLLYLYPAGLTPDFLQFMADNLFPLLPYFDIPIQHSHPQILERMGRPFARDPRYVLDLVRKYLPKAIFRTTVIVGFPGETEEHFQHLLRFVEEGHFLHLGVFSYEREEGTKAYDYKDQVPKDLADERREILLEAQRCVSSDLLEDYVGQKYDVLIDSVNPEWPGLFNGRVWFQAPEVDGQTYISGDGLKVGSCVNAEIVESSDYDLTALV